MSASAGAEPRSLEAAPGPFANFDAALARKGQLREAITAACRTPEPDCVPPLVEAATLPAKGAERVRTVARKIVTAIRAKDHGTGVEGLIQEYSLSSEEGVSLMCLAEALLRIPDNATRDALIRDKLATGDWLAHVSADNSLFVNAATWGLAVTGRLIHPIDQSGLSSALARLLARGGEPLIRRGVDMAMRMMGEQFVTGQTIGEALANSHRLQARGFTHSYDMLGEAATTAADAARYLADYENAIHAIGEASAGQGPYRGAGISIKLSALHPRYERAQLPRVMGELLPRLQRLALLARRYDIGLNIDAEEADRLEISLDLLEALCLDPELAGWNGLGFVVQAYGKRCPFVIDFLIDLGRRSNHRLMVRLVKGAYWDSEIKKAQVAGLAGFPVYTRKLYSDVAYIACARKLLGAPTEIFPQFATHNAQTVATILELAGPDFAVGHYEFQCLHGMGEPLYEEVVGPQKLDRPCRIYAPVGSHNTLLAYLVRRLLENGANSSFVNRIADEAVSIDELVSDPAAAARNISPLGAPHPHIDLPSAILAAGRKNSAGIDLASDATLRHLQARLVESVATQWLAMPMLGDGHGTGTEVEIANPANPGDIVGHAIFADATSIDRAFALSSIAAPGWAAMLPSARAQILLGAADIMEAKLPALIGLIIREAGKSAQNAIGEVREAVDFLRYYAGEACDGFDNTSHLPLGIVVAISPWNFPLSIFTGQLAGALAAGNAVIAKPAEETPLIAAEAVRILQQAGVPPAILQLLPGAGDVGASLVAHPQAAGVVFTGSTEVARLIQKQLAARVSPDGRPIPLIAETGGQNAMIVDSSALTEQVVGDVLASAFDSAGQRCSALRVLCLQDDIADRTLAMLKGALAELRTGDPARLMTDVGPVISAAARDNIMRHVDAMRAAGRKVEQSALTPEAGLGSFVAPTLIEIASLGDLRREVFGPVLHVLRYRRDDLDRLVEAINALGYGLTFGLHTRLDETIARVTSRIRIGNIYINRNTIGAVVGVQPFGGHGLSGTGPKAGGPLYLRRLLRRHPLAMPGVDAMQSNLMSGYLDWLAVKGFAREAGICAEYAAASPVRRSIELAGPVGESNIYRLEPRGMILCLPTTETGLLLQIGAVLATGNRALIVAPETLGRLLAGLPPSIAARLSLATDWQGRDGLAGALVEASAETILKLLGRIADLPGPLVTVQGAPSPSLADGSARWDLDLLLTEVSSSINTAAAGGNASLMTLGG